MYKHAVAEPYIITQLYPASSVNINANEITKLGLT